MSLRVLTLNTWGMPWPIGRDLAERMGAIGEVLPTLDLDVAAFQEVWRASARASLRPGRAPAGPEHARPPPPPHRGGG
ncbi:MAG: hypothetical protein ACE5FL_10580, partial [Myxococcota bacterium]